MTEKKQTSTERVKAHQARKKARKEALAKIGFTEIPLLVRKDQVFSIENAAKMLKKPAGLLLHSITQPAIIKLCQKHDEILTRNAEAEFKWLRDIYKKETGLKFGEIPVDLQEIEEKI